MSAASLPAMLGAARARGYAVPAFNIVDELSMSAVLGAAVSERSPVIIQTSAVVAKRTGPRLLALVFAELVERLDATAVLQLDHTNDGDLARECIDSGWQAVLFDGSSLPVGENLRQTRAIARHAHDRGAAVEGELEAIRGTEYGVGHGGVSRHDLDVVLGFIDGTDIDCFAPSIGNVHGHADRPVTLDIDRVARLRAGSAVALALHGGTGIPNAEVEALIGAGIAKINVSTALREAYLGATRAYLTANPAANDPVPMFEVIRTAVATTAAEHMHRFRSANAFGPILLEPAS